MSLNLDLEGVVKDLSELKGLPQKMGQMLAIDSTQLFPEEMREKFKILQKDAVAIDFSLVQKLILKELGPEKFQKIEFLDQKPIGVGSISQVHRGKIAGREVVFKVQLPNLKETIQSDVLMLKAFSALYNVARPESKDIKNMIAEAESMLMYEIQFDREVQFLEKTAQILQGEGNYFTPQVFGEFSTKRLITLEYIEGTLLSDWIKKPHTHEEILWVSQTLVDLFVLEFFKFGVVQTDPNFANFIVTKDRRVALIDFGAGKEFNAKFRRDYFQLLKAGVFEDREMIIHWGEFFGLVSRQDTDEAINLFVDFVMKSMRYFSRKYNPMDFGEEAFTSELVKLGTQLWLKQKKSDPKSDLVFLHRKASGIFHLIKDLKVKMDLSDVFDRAEKAIDEIT